MQSLKSSALEPTRPELAGLSRGQIIVRLLPIYGLPILTVVLIAFFSLLLPASFPTAINARSILSDKAIIALLSLAAMVPMMAGRIDLTVGFGIVMWHILAISLQVKYGIPWPVACLAVIACAGIAGLINGMLVEVAQIDSFIATLGTGTILYALALWHTEGRQVIGVFVASGVLVGFTGCVLASKLQIGQANVGLDYLLPALVGTFLGSTTIRPGRVNVWGTIIGVLILAVGISGIQQLGGAFFVEPLFNGVTLLVSIALAGFAQRRRSATTRKPPVEVPHGV